MNLGAGGEGRERMKPKISLCLEIRRKSFCDSSHFVIHVLTLRKSSTAVQARWGPYCGHRQERASGEVYSDRLAIR